LILGKAKKRGANQVFFSSSSDSSLFAKPFFTCFTGLFFLQSKKPSPKNRVVAMALVAAKRTKPAVGSCPCKRGWLAMFANSVLKTAIR